MITRRDFLATGMAATALVSACRQQERPRATAPASPAADAPGVPQVLVVDAGAPFARYLAEVLAVEGVLGIALADGRLAVPESLARVQAVAVHGSTLSDGWLPALEAFVQRGGALAGIDAPSGLLARFGIVVRDGAVSHGDGLRDVPVTLAFAGREAPGARVVVRSSSWVTAAGAVVDASIEAPPGHAAGPALVRVERGAGCATFWSFDVAKNIACLRQGHPGWVDRDRDGAAGVRAIDAMVGWLQPSTLAHADADLLARAVVDRLSAPSGVAGPLVRADHFPGGAQSVLVPTADAHGVGAGVIDGLVQRLEAAGGSLSIYYAPPESSPWRRRARRWRWAAGDLPLVGRAAYSAAAPPPPRLVNDWRRRGHEFAPHPDVDRGLAGGLAAAWRRFDEDGYGTGHVTTRTHKVLWSGWAETARAQRAIGVRMNLDAYAVGPAMRAADGAWGHGHINGSGLPLRFVEPSGVVVDCYQQATQIVDEQWLGAFGGPEGLSGADAGALAARLVASSASGPPVAWCAQFHADGFAADPFRASQSVALLEATLAACRRLRIPVLAAAQWLAFLDARRATAIAERHWNAATRTLTCAIDVGRVAGTLGLLVPATLGGAGIATARIDGAHASLDERVIDGRPWARCLVAAGRHQLEITYGVTSFIATKLKT